MAVPRTYGVLLFDGFTALDVIGPLAFLENLPGVRIHVIHDSYSHVPSAGHWPSEDRFAGQLYIPTHTMDDPPKLDVLIVPGGSGTRRLAEDRRWDQFVTRMYPNLQYLLSICTGTSIVARSGVLDGRRATTNKAAYRWVTSQGPRVNWVPGARWVVDGNIWTSSGIEAGTDMGHAFVKAIYGESAARAIANKLEYIPTNDPSHDPFAAIYDLVPSSKPRFISPAPPPTMGFRSRWGILSYPGFITLDAIGVATFAECFSKRPELPCSVSLIAPTPSAVRPFSSPSASGIQLAPTHTLENAPLELDVLIVPGLPTAGPFPYHNELVSYIQKVYPTVKGVISIGTGSMLLAAAGVLDNRRATTSKSVFDAATAPFRQRERNIKWTTGRWVRDGNVWTASGTAAGLDAANALCTEMFGETATRNAAKLMEYVPRTDASDDPFAEIWAQRTQARL